MPSRRLVEPPTPPIHHHGSHLMAPLAGGVAAGFSILVLLTFCIRKVSRKRTVPSSDAESKPPHKFSYTDLRRATSSFAASLRLGQGGFGSVYRGTLQKPNISIAVKVMDAGSLQGEREFHNELFLAGKIDSKYIVSVLGFSSDRKRRRMLLVYELMVNGSLQDCLLHRKCTELKNWEKRFIIALDIAKGLEYLHHHCDPPIIHGDIKPSNILLDTNFNAKISDFGLARVKSDDQVEIEVKKENGLEDNGSIYETESVITTNGCEEVHGGGVEQSPASVLIVEASPETGTELSPEAPIVSPRIVAAMVSPASVSEVNFDGCSMESGKEVKKSSRKKKKNFSGKEWWWKQDNAEEESGPVKDYVMEWIGNEIKKERPKSDWTGTTSSSGVTKIEKKKTKRRLDWWVSMDDDKNMKKDKRRPAREWWKEEYCDELTRKKKKKKKESQGYSSEDNYWPRDEGFQSDRKRRSRSRSSNGSSIGELWRARRNSHDSVSGEIPKSGGVSSTPSMRGTVCYIAPEYGNTGDLSEKCDVYSYGVLLLVLIAGRRPLQVTGSPMVEFQRANLLSWTRHLARRGKLLELVDQSIESFDKEQALLCITVALQCLQKSPVSRPSMKEVAGYLAGEIEPPQLPVEFSPSPPSRFPFKSHKKVR